MQLIDCMVCGPWLYRGPVEEVRAAAVWHVYLRHRRVWDRVIGDRPPRDRMPAVVLVPRLSLLLLLARAARASEAARRPATQGVD